MQKYTVNSKNSIEKVIFQHQLYLANGPVFICALLEDILFSGLTECEQLNLAGE